MHERSPAPTRTRWKRRRCIGIYIYDVRDNTQQPIVVPQEGFIYTEVVAGSPRTLPPVILDRAAGVDFPPELLTESRRRAAHPQRLRHRRRRPAPGGIATVRNPANAGYATRPARFLRIEKAVSQPDDDTRDIANTAFGPNRALGMRDILGYAPIEPDGSVKVKVPANVAFNISVLDANGRRLPACSAAATPTGCRCMPGETLECNGCHNANDHSAARPWPRRPDRFGERRRADDRQPVPEHQSRAVRRRRRDDGRSAQPRHVRRRLRAERRPRVRRLLAGDAGHDAFESTRATRRPVDRAVRSGRSDASRHTCVDCADARLLPTGRSACTDAGTACCRITIHYEQHIHPLWGVDRFVDANGDGVPDIDPATVQPINHKCKTCHAPVDAANAAQVPAGQLDLTDGPSDDEAGPVQVPIASCCSATSARC